MAGMRRLVISGGIGSGKSAVRRLLSEAGVHTVDADAVGHEVLLPDGPAFEAVADRWPAVVVDGRIDRAALGAIVFADHRELRLLESITHPHIFGRIRGAVEGIDAPVAVEVPLIDHGMGPGWARLVVDSTDETRVERLLGRGMAAEDATARMASQPARGEWLASADLVVPNHGTLGELEDTVARLAGAISGV